MLFTVIISIFFISFSNADNITEKNVHKTNNNIRSIYTWSNGTSIMFNTTLPGSNKIVQVDCFGLGSTFAQGLNWVFRPRDSHKHTLDIRFFLTSRRKPKRVEVLVGDQFGLEWTDLVIERKTVFIIHGFLSHGKQSWVQEMETAFREAEDVNVVVVDWSAHGNTWNYYRAAINAKSVGSHIAKFLSHIVNATLEEYSKNLQEINWGPIHMVGHSLGAHICGIVATEFKKYSTPWKIKRITGLDPAQPCFSNSQMSLGKDKAEFVDIIHTNGRFLSQLGFGLPDSIGHVDFYPSGGKNQISCVNSQGSYFDYLGIPVSSITRAICSHGLSYLYFTESIIATIAQNGTFWGHRWDRSYERALNAINEPCDSNKCVEMGINSIKYATRGSFFVVTSSSRPFYAIKNNDLEELKQQLSIDFKHY